MKYVVAILDGCADFPLENLGGRTPLEAADTPAADALASSGEVLRVDTVPNGVPAGSDTAILSIFGCDPRVCYTGRAPLEAAGAGVVLREGETAMRANVVSLSEDMRIVSHNGGGLEGAKCREIGERLIPLLEGHGIKLHVSNSFRHIAVMPRAVSETQIPPHDHLGERADGLLSGIFRELTLKSYEIAKPYALWFWAAGAVCELPPLYGRYGKRASAVSAVPLAQGIARLCGAEVIDVPTATGEIDTDYEGKAAAVLKSLSDGADVCFLHVEAPDECAHAKDAAMKTEAIRRFGARCLRPLIDGLESLGDHRIALLSDHYTLTASGAHDGTPVPCILYDSRRKQNNPARFTEKFAAKGRLIAGTKLLEVLFNES